MEEHWYSTTEAGRILGIHPSTVRELIEEGRLAARVYRYSAAGRPTIRIRASDIEAFVARWADLEIGLADASIVVLSERHDTVRLLSLDERHFRSLRGARGRRFRLLPFENA